jgi:hypothetical protein
MSEDNMVYGGLMSAPVFFAKQQKNTIIQIPASIIAIRFDRKMETGILSILKEVIKEQFIEIPKDDESSKEMMSVEFTEKAELKVWIPTKFRRKNVVTFPSCSCGWSKTDFFLSIALRDLAGTPIVPNISILRSLLMKLREKEVKYEIW